MPLSSPKLHQLPTSFPTQNFPFYSPPHLPWLAWGLCRFSGGRGYGLEAQGKILSEVLFSFF